jgi:hypothetical protein
MKGARLSHEGPHEFVDYQCALCGALETGLISTDGRVALMAAKTIGPKTIARRIRGQATKLEQYLSEELGQRGDYTVVTALRTLADEVAGTDEASDDGGDDG